MGLRVAIVGVGNCASSLVQGVEYYADAAPDTRVPGLMHVQFGPYHVSDIEWVAAFDVDAKKRSARISHMRSWPAKTTPSRSPMYPPPGSSCNAATPWMVWASTTARPSWNPMRSPWTWWPRSPRDPR